MRKLFLPQTELVAALPWSKRKQLGQARGAWVAACYALHRCHLARYTIRDFKWLNLWSQTMGRLAKSGKNWAKVKDMLLTAGLLDCNGKSKHGKHSLGFRLGPALADAKWKLSADPFDIPDVPEFEHSGRAVWPGLTIDKPMAHRILETIAPERGWCQDRLDAWHYRVGQFSPAYTVGVKTGRMTTDANQFPRETRRALLIHGDPTVEIDIRSCHPMLMATLYPQKSTERLRYLECLESGIYEHFAGLLGTDRDGAKERFNPWLNGKGDKEFGKVFGSEFPELTTLARAKAKKFKNALCHDLQRKESTIIRDACTKFEAVSIHDGIRVQDVKEKDARAYLLYSIYKRHGLRAALK